MSNEQAERAAHPGEHLRDRLTQRGWTQDELALVTGRSRQQINDIIAGRRGITPEMAVALSAAFGTSPDYWLAMDSAHRLSEVTEAKEPIVERARLFDIAPIRDMQKRGWLPETKSTDELTEHLKAFFGVSSLDDDSLRTHVAMRRTQTEESLTPSQRAWCFRVRQMARLCLVADFRADNLDSCKRQLRKLAAYPQEAHKVSQCLADFGIRFVVVEPLAGTKVDGVAMWLDHSSPAIGMSLRYHRIDSFWHTLCHELSHVMHCDEAPLDSDLTDEMEGVTIVKSEMEQRADKEAADTLVPLQELQSFILRVGPLYSKDRIVRFAHRIKIHPGIIVGQLQHRGEIGYRANREMLAKIRDYITSVALTDGWGSFISPEVLK